MDLVALDGNRTASSVNPSGGVKRLRSEMHGLAYTGPPVCLFDRNSMKVTSTPTGNKLGKAIGGHCRQRPCRSPMRNSVIGTLSHAPRLSQELTLSAFYLHRTTRRDARGPRRVTVGRSPSWSPLQVARRFKMVKSSQMQEGCPSWKQTDKRQRHQIPPTETATKAQRHLAQTARLPRGGPVCSLSGGLAPVGWPRRLPHGSDDGAAPSLRAGIASRCAAVVRPA
jgi:hypothetical protein